MGTHSNTKAGNKHQGGFSCYVPAILDEEAVEDVADDIRLETSRILCAAVLTTAGVIAVSDAFTSGIPLIS